MKLSELTDEEYILPELKAKDKKGVLEELVDALVKREPSIDKKSLVRCCWKGSGWEYGDRGWGGHPSREIPWNHHPIISFGRSRAGLDFEAMDGEPVHLSFSWWPGEFRKHPSQSPAR